MGNIISSQEKPDGSSQALCTPNSVEAWAREKGETVAASEDGETMTWREWNQRADRVAEGLMQRGLGEGDIVVVRTQVRLEWLVINTALAKIGCRLLGLNWRLTPAECEYVLSNSRAAALICDDPDPSLLRPVIEPLGLKLCVSLMSAAPGFVMFDEVAAAPAVARFAKREAPLIIYTSGTTGLPKGVVLPGAGDARMAEYRHDIDIRLSVAETEVILVTMPFSHSAGPVQVRRAIRLGARIVLLRRFDPEAALAAIDRHGVTTWVAVPTMIKRIAALPDEVRARFDLSTLSSLQVGAAPTTREMKQWIMREFGADVLQESYGSTETGMIAHMPPAMQNVKPGATGRPYRHVTIEIRDDLGRVLPPGEQGEVWARTPSTITAYLGQPPLGPDVRDTEGFFRTGDVGIVDADGYLYLTDRAKDMIVSGGVNLYPAEIEEALLRHPAVQDVAVIGIPHDEFGEQVKAFVEVKPGHRLDIVELQRHAGEQLASYKRPKSFEIIGELPRNLTGKILKRELREPYWKGRERAI